MAEDGIREIRPDGFDDKEHMEHLPMPGSPEFRNIERDSAKLKMLEYTVLTPPDRMREMTYLGAHEIHDLASMITLDAMTKKDYKVGTAFTIWLDAFFALRRSVGARHLNKTYGLAEATMLTEDKEPTGMALELE